jgi:DNA-binding response OmpR family regulator
VLRRSVAAAAPVAEQVALGGATLDIGRRELRTATATVPLTEQETAVVRCLAQHRDRVVARDELLAALAGGGGIDRSSRAVDMLVARLRDKLSERLGPAGASLIRTVRGVGYQVEIPS